MAFPLKTDFVVGIICESSEWKRIEMLFEGREDIHLVHIYSVEDTFARGFSFVIDLIRESALENYNRVIREFRYRMIPILDKPDLLFMLTKLFIND
jgi:hypothetical protein